MAATILSLLGAPMDNDPLKAMYSTYFKTPLPAIKKERSRRQILLYFVSNSVPLKTMKRVLHDAHSEGLEILFVWRGITQKMLSSMRLIAKKDHFLAKVHPLLFQDLNITRVPSFVLARCPKPFRSKACEYLFRMDGDVSLSFFLKKVAIQKGYRKGVR